MEEFEELLRKMYLAAEKEKLRVVTRVLEITLEVGDTKPIADGHEDDITALAKALLACAYAGDIRGALGGCMLLFALGHKRAMDPNPDPEVWGKVFEEEEDGS